MNGEAGGLELLAISHGYGARGQANAVSAVSFHVPQGEFWTLLGPSGSGKSTLLRIIGGYIRPDHGRVVWADREITELAPRYRDMGMVFQDYALFPHMTVFENIAYGLRARRLAESEIRARVGSMLELNRLLGFEKRFPPQLSGGQQQRVALARALALRPCVLLMDEPMGALDLKLREAMAVEVRKIQRQLATTTIHVTHDQSEAMTMSDRIVVLRAGRIEQIGRPEELSARPANRFVAEFVGANNVIPVTTGGNSGNGVRGTIDGVDGEILLCATGEVSANRRFYLVTRPEQTVAVAATTHGFGLTGTVRATKYFGTTRCLLIETRSGIVVASLDVEGQFSVGDVVRVSWDIERALLVPDAPEFESVPGDAAEKHP